MYSNISQVLLLYKTWRHYNKCGSTKSFRVYYWYVKIRQCRYMGHGLKYITFYVQKHVAPLPFCYNLLLVRNNPLGAHAFVRLVCWINWCHLNVESGYRMQICICVCLKWPSMQCVQLSWKLVMIWQLIGAISSKASCWGHLNWCFWPTDLNWYFGDHRSEK